VRHHVFAATRLHADDTPVPVLAPGHGRTKTGRLWTYVRDGRPCADPVPPAVWFAFSPDRRGEHPQTHLKDFQGTLQADAYAGFHPLYEGGRIAEAACWAHTRRKFHDILAATDSPTAAEAVRRIGELYAVEKQVRGSPPEIRLAGRQTRVRPIMQDLRRWLDRTLQDLSAKSDMAGAIRYALTRWTALTRYLDDGTIEIDNNAAERALRVVALGRKTICSLARTAAENAPPPSTLCSVQPSSTASTRNGTSDTSRPTSQSTRSTASQSSCHGTSLHSHYRHND